MFSLRIFLTVVAVTTNVNGAAVEILVDKIKLAPGPFASLSAVYNVSITLPVLSVTSTLKFAASFSLVFCKINVAACPLVESNVDFSWKLIPALSCPLFFPDLYDMIHKGNEGFHRDNPKAHIRASRRHGGR